MSKKHLLVLTVVAVVLAVLLSSCNKEPAPIQRDAPEATDKMIPAPVAVSAEMESKLVLADTKFGFNLFSQLVGQNQGKNIFISPPSIAIALAMTYNGARGETKEAMAKALEIEGMNLEDVNGANAALKAKLQSIDPKVELTIANSLWARQGFQFKEDFLQRNKDFYSAEVAALDFSRPEASKTINKWVKDNTRGKIPKIVGDQIDTSTILFLINAVYFKGDWSVKFDKSLTKQLDFNLPDGTKKKHPMMRQSGKYQYFKEDNFQAVSLPYGEGKTAMYIFLPAREFSLQEFQKKLNAGDWEKWISRFAQTKGEIIMPKFKLEYERTLNGGLGALGMGIAFDKARANFENMAPVSPNSNVFIKEVLHKTFVDVNEEGTEAAAATKVEMGVTSARQPEPSFSMVVDRPFFFAIRDNQTGTVLFMGSIVDPQL